RRRCIRGTRARRALARPCRPSAPTCDRPEPSSWAPERQSRRHRPSQFLLTSDKSGVQAPTVNTARCHCGFSQTIIHGVPNLSVSIANFAAKKVSPSGTATVAFGECIENALGLGRLLGVDCDREALHRHAAGAALRLPLHPKS